MKKIFRYKILLVLTVILAISACTKDWEELNTNPNEANDPPATNIFAWSIRYFAQSFYDDWQDMNNYASYAGHLGKIQYIDESRYEFRGSVVNNAWEDMYRVILNLQKVIDKSEAEGDLNLMAAAMTMQTYALQIATDTWKAIPYTEAIQGENEITAPKYDDQDSIYSGLLTTLKAAGDIFALGDATSTGGGDILFYGDVAGWQKFCNSLRLRVANRISNVDPTTAQTHIEEILNNQDKYPIITSNADNVALRWDGSSYFEPWYENYYLDGRDDHGMGKPLVDSMLNYNDPRLPVYALLNDSGYYEGVTPGAENNSFDINLISRIGTYYRGIAAGQTFFMRYPEIQFIIAEATLNGWNTGADAQTAYEAGVTASLEEHGITGDTAYLQEPQVAWDAGSMTNYEKIYVQKWISLFKQGHEAWAEVRRTDVPLCLEAPGSPYGTHDRCPFRYPYPSTEYSLNGANINAVDDGIVDHFWGQQMWWDTRTGIK